ncbi:complex I subunit 1/NuoH family protein [Oleiharenicola sp. Vm1]|uniref:complex I subunit 1/NuoH family protein n=1 Tax=Oleiharenicola sp. Vm1 TaxID=3398393 RepID=UPI0039F4AEAC
MVEFWQNLHPAVQLFVKGLAVVLVIFPLGGIGSLAERKISAWIQGRPGPNRAIPIWFAWVPVLGPFLQRLGVFHLMADGLKMLFKEDALPGHVNKVYFVLAPIVAMIPALTTVTAVPFGAYLNGQGELVPLVLANLDVGILAVFAVSSLGVYSLIIAGWASNSKYPFLGGIRASAQLISYELSMTLSVLPVFLWINAPGTNGSLSLFNVVQFQSGTDFLGGLWFFFLMPVSALVFLVALFAETNRLPFDMAEGEADLVGGFHTEYGAFKWGLFFVAEYAHMIVGSGVFVLLFLGGWNPLPWLPLEKVLAWFGVASNPFIFGIASIVVFLAKVLFFIFVFMWVRWTVPRFRYDQVMKLGWQKLLPLAIGNLLFYAAAIAIIELHLGIAAWVALALATIVALFAILRPQAQAAL